MRSKKVALTLAFSAVFVVLLSLDFGKDSASGRDRGEPLDYVPATEKEFALSFTTSDRSRVVAHSDAEADDWERTTAGSGADAPAEIPETRGAYDDEETVWGDRLPEDRSVYASEPTQQFWQWRRVLADEAPDTTWTEQLGSELSGRMRELLGTSAALHQIDCRETMCQLYLHTDDPQDGAALFAAMRSAGTALEHQQLAASVQLEGAAYGGTTHELVVRRERPDWMPPHVDGAARAHRPVLAAEEGDE
jgi:hypothetical protein